MVCAYAGPAPLTIIAVAANTIAAASPMAIRISLFMSRLLL